MSSFSCRHERSWLPSGWDVLSASRAPEPERREDDPETETESGTVSGVHVNEDNSRAQFTS